jgi:hypothetical protein
MPVDSCPSVGLGLRGASDYLPDPEELGAGELVPAVEACFAGLLISRSQSLAAHSGSVFFRPLQASLSLLATSLTAAPCVVVSNDLSRAVLLTVAPWVASLFALPFPEALPVSVEAVVPDEKSPAVPAPLVPPLIVPLVDAPLEPSDLPSPVELTAPVPVLLVAAKEPLEYVPDGVELWVATVSEPGDFLSLFLSPSARAEPLVSATIEVKMNTGASLRIWASW